MKSKVDVFYEWPIAALTHLSESEDAEAFSLLLVEPESTKFLNLTGQLAAVRNQLVEHNGIADIYDDWLAIEIHLSKFETSFANFPNHELRKLRLFCLLAGKLSDQLNNTETELDAVQLDETTFELIPVRVRHPIAVNWFKFENADRPEDSAAIFRIVDLDTSGDLREKIVRAIDVDAIDTPFLFLFLATLSEHPGELLNRQQVLIKRKNKRISAPKAEAYIKLLMLARGIKLHEFTSYEAAPRLANESLFKPELNYQQFRETFNVVSEYNGRKDILSKYLSLYHIFENLMYKRPIAELSRRIKRMFTVRDFKHLYKRVESNEGEALQDLFSIVFARQVEGETFKKRIEDRWSLICNGHETEVNDLLTHLKITRGNGFLEDHHFVHESKIYFVKIVYAIRNVIVHNTETEWHLSLANLSESRGAEHVIRDFLIPSLEEICFELLGQEVNEVWYPNRTMNLY